MLNCAACGKFMAANGAASCSVCPAIPQAIVNAPPAAFPSPVTVAVRASSSTSERPPRNNEELEFASLALAECLAQIRELRLGNTELKVTLAGIIAGLDARAAAAAPAAPAATSAPAAAAAPSTVLPVTVASTTVPPVNAPPAAVPSPANFAVTASTSTTERQLRELRIGDEWEFAFLELAECLDELQELKREMAELKASIAGMLARFGVTAAGGG